MVQELPQRFAGHGDAGLRPLAGLLGGAEDRGLDLFGRRGRITRIIDAHIHRAIAHRPETRHDACADDRRLAQSRLPEQYGERLALHAPGELGHFVLAAVEVRARLFGERVEAEPRVLRVYRWLRRRVGRSARRVFFRRRRTLGRTCVGQRFRRPGPGGAVSHDGPRGNPAGGARTRARLRRRKAV